MTGAHSRWPHEWIDPAFWVSVLVAIGTAGSAIVATVLGISAYRGDKRRRKSYQESELNRQAELQALFVHLGRGGLVVEPNGQFAWVIIRNDSDKLITNARVGISVGGADYWSGTITAELGPGSSSSFKVGGFEPFDGERAYWAPIANFDDAYGRHWVLNSEGQYQLFGGHRVSAHPNVQKMMLDQAP